MPTAKWNNESFTFDLPSPETKLAVVRQIVADYTHLPRDAFKLIHAGAIMKDDNAPISAYKLRKNSTIAVIAPAADKPLPATPATQSQHSTISRIQSELDNVRTNLTPSLEAFLSSQSRPQKEHNRLGELLLQSLLRLDAITADGEWEDARRERKAAVKEVQGLLDRLDGTP